MTLFIIALQAEAKPLIDLYSLKSETDAPYPTYHDSEISVIISGIGMLNASAATAYALSRFSPATVINYGTCAAANDRHAIGTLWQIDKLVDTCSDRVYHLVKRVSLAPHASLHTLPRPTSTNKKTKITLADMEAAGFYTAACHFLKRDQIVILKVVSDYMEEKILSQEEHNALQQKHLPLLQRLIKNQF